MPETTTETTTEAPAKNTITVSLERHFTAFLLKHDDGRSCLFQTDWDFPGLCSSLGHNVACCGSTDGTTDCAEHGTTAHEMIAAAAEWLDEQAGYEVEIDPWVFDQYCGE